MAEIVNTNAECLRLYLEHGTTTLAEIKNRVNATFGYVRLQCFLEILMVVSQVVREHIGDDETCAGVAMYLLRLLNEAQPTANDALPDWAPLFDDLKTVSTAIAHIIGKSRKQAIAYMLQKMAFYLVFLVLLTAFSYVIICNSAGDLKELCTAFLPQTVAVVFQLVEMAFHLYYI